MLRGKHSIPKFVELTGADIDDIAWNNKAMPENASRSDMIYFHLVRSLYGYVKCGTMPIDNAKHQKRVLSHYYETVVELAQSSGRLICELNRLIAPTSQFKDKSREELIGIIAKMDALCSGVIRTAEEKCPGIIEEVKR